MVDPDELKHAIGNALAEKVARLMFTGTLVLLETPIDPKSLRGFLQSYFVYCPSGEFRKVLFMYYTEPQCYIQKIKTLKGRKLAAVFVRDTLSRPDVIPFFPHERDEFIDMVADMIASMAVTYDRGLYEAFVRGFLNDPDSVVLFAPNDFYTVVSAFEKLFGRKEVKYDYIVTKRYIVVKVGKNHAQNVSADSLIAIPTGNGVRLEEMNREDMFALVIEDYPEFRSEVMKNLAENDELREFVEQFVEQDRTAD